MTKRAVLYARVSGDDSKYATSGIDSQLKDCQKYAIEKGYTIVGKYYEEKDGQTSGAAWLPELEKVVKLAEQRGFEVLIVREIDRLARNRFKQLSVENRLESCGTKVEYVIGQFEDSASGRLLKGMMGEFAEFERELIRERTIRGIEDSVRAGNVRIGGSNAPYGYDIAKINGRRTLKINEQEAAVIRLMFDLYVNHHYSLNGIANYLNEHNVPKPSKGNNHKAAQHKTRKLGWGIGTLHAMFCNEVYVGRWYYRKTKQIKDPKTGKKRRVKRPKSEWILVEVPAILSEEIFNKATERLEANKRKMGKHRKYFYALGGMLKCGHCQKGMTGVTFVKGRLRGQYYLCNATHNHKRYGYKCDNARYYAVDVENSVWFWIKSILLSPEQLSEALVQYQEKQLAVHKPVQQMIEANQEKLHGLMTERERLVKAYKVGVLDLNDLASEKPALDKSIQELQEAIKSLENELNYKLLTQDEITTVEAYAAKVREGADLADNDPQAQRAIFELLDVQVTLASIDGEKWADVVCVLGEKHLPTDSTTSRYNGNF